MFLLLAVQIHMKPFFYTIKTVFSSYFNEASAKLLLHKENLRIEIEKKLPVIRFEHLLYRPDSRLLYAKKYCRDKGLPRFDNSIQRSLQRPTILRRNLAGSL